VIVTLMVTVCFVGAYCYVTSMVTACLCTMHVGLVTLMVTAC